MNADSSSQIFDCSSEKQMKCSSLRFKFVSVKVTPNTVQLQSVKFSLLEERVNKKSVQGDGSYAAAPPMAQAGAFGGPSISGDGGVGQFSVVVEAVKLSLLQDISRLLDSKLAPIAKKLETLDVRMSRLSSEVVSLQKGSLDNCIAKECTKGGADSGCQSKNESTEAPPPTANNEQSSNSTSTAEQSESIKASNEIQSDKIHATDGEMSSDKKGRP